jgi:hypothetical protein
MLGQLLRLAGVDLEARVSAAKARLEDKAQHLFDRVKGELRTFALGAGLLATAGVMALLALIVGLMALYQALEASLGSVGALLAIVGVLVLLAVLCAVAGRAALGAKAEPDYLLFPPTVVVTPVVVDAEDQQPRAAGPDHLIATVISALARFFPLTGNWAIDGALRHVTRRTQGTVHEAVTRAAGLVESGSRPAMLGVLGGAVLVGFLIARRRR